MRAWLIRVLQRVIAWLSQPEPIPEPTPLEIAAATYVRWAEDVHAGKDGEYKRHQVLAKLLKAVPPKRKGDRIRIARAIEDAVERLS